MFLRLFSPIPFWRPLIAYDRDAHSAAAQKFFVLWCISISPLIFAALAAPLAGTNTDRGAAFMSSIGQSFQGTHQFIYAVSFITPIFYLLWEKYQQLAEHAGAGKRSLRDLKILPLGYGWILLWSVLVFLVTAVAYANSTTIRNQKPLTLLQELSSNKWVAVGVYSFALLCWYFTILDSLGTPKIDYIGEVRKEETKQAKDFSDRIAKRKESNSD